MSNTKNAQVTRYDADNGGHPFPAEPKLPKIKHKTAARCDQWLRRVFCWTRHELSALYLPSFSDSARSTVCLATFRFIFGISLLAFSIWNLIAFSHSDDSSDGYGSIGRTFSQITSWGFTFTCLYFIFAGGGYLFVTLWAAHGTSAFVSGLCAFLSFGRTSFLPFEVRQQSVQNTQNYISQKYMSMHDTCGTTTPTAHASPRSPDVEPVTELRVPEEIGDAPPVADRLQMMQHSDSRQTAGIMTEEASQHISAEVVQISRSSVRTKNLPVIPDSLFFVPNDRGVAIVRPDIYKKYAFDQLLVPTSAGFVSELQSIDTLKLWAQTRLIAEQEDNEILKTEGIPSQKYEFNILEDLHRQQQHLRKQIATQASVLPSGTITEVGRLTQTAGVRHILTPINVTNDVMPDITNQEHDEAVVAVQDPTTPRATSVEHIAPRHHSPRSLMHKSIPRVWGTNACIRVVHKHLPIGEHVFDMVAMRLLHQSNELLEPSNKSTSQKDNYAIIAPPNRSSEGGSSFIQRSELNSTTDSSEPIVQPIIGTIHPLENQERQYSYVMLDPFVPSTLPITDTVLNITLRMKSKPSPPTYLMSGQQAAWAGYSTVATSGPIIATRLHDALYDTPGIGRFNTSSLITRENRSSVVILNPVMTAIEMSLFRQVRSAEVAPADVNEITTDENNAPYPVPNQVFQSPVATTSDQIIDIRNYPLLERQGDLVMVNMRNEPKYSIVTQYGYVPGVEKIALLRLDHAFRAITSILWTISLPFEVSITILFWTGGASTTTGTGKSELDLGSGANLVSTVIKHTIVSVLLLDMLLNRIRITGRKLVYPISTAFNFLWVTGVYTAATRGLGVYDKLNWQSPWTIALIAIGFGVLVGVYLVMMFISRFRDHLCWNCRRNKAFRAADKLLASVKNEFHATLQEKGENNVMEAIIQSDYKPHPMAELSLHNVPNQTALRV